MSIHLLQLKDLMEKRASEYYSEEIVTEMNTTQLRLRLLQAAGGNAAFAQKLREMLWQSYCDANCPFGSSEQGMLTWLAYSGQSQ